MSAPDSGVDFTSSSSDSSSITSEKAVEEQLQEQLQDVMKQLCMLKIKDGQSSPVKNILGALCEKVQINHTKLHEYAFVYHHFKNTNTIITVCENPRGADLLGAKGEKIELKSAKCSCSLRKDRRCCSQFTLRPITKKIDETKADYLKRVQNNATNKVNQNGYLVINFFCQRKSHRITYKISGNFFVSLLIHMADHKQGQKNFHSKICSKCNHFHQLRYLEKSSETFEEIDPIKNKDTHKDFFSRALKYKEDYYKEDYCS